MSKALRNFMIILLVLLLVGGACWYLFIYRSSLPATIYTTLADFFDEHGRAATAVHFYAKASAQDPGNLDLAIETANAYEACGNYTKAEYVLVRAISHSPDALDGYLALSSVYVAQDKLLDAERLISACSNEQIKEQLSALRPSAPVIQADTEFSLEPITAALSYTGGTAYYSVTEEYPTLGDEPYEAPFTLGYGTTQVTAIVVGENGLVSPLVSADFTVCGEITTVTFASEDFDTWYREQMGISRHADIISSDLWTVSELTLPAEVADLSDLSWFVGLTRLELQGTTAEDFSPLTSLPLLESLDLTGTALQGEDLESIAAIPTLKELRIGSCGVADLTALSALSALTVLDISDNQIASIEALAALPALEELRMQGNQVDSIAALAAAGSLRILDVSGNAIENLGALSANTALEELHADECGISDLSPLENKTALTVLSAAKNKIDDISALKNCIALQELDLSSNQIATLAPLYALTSMTNLDVSSNLLAVSPSFTDDNGLIFLNLSFNALEEVDGLTNLHELNYLNVNNNRLTDISVIADLANLIQVDALQNPLVGVASLESRSIVVSYDPGFTLPEEETEKGDEATEGEAASDSAPAGETTIE